MTPIRTGRIGAGSVYGP